MRKFKWFLMMLFMIIPYSVSADHMYSVDMDIDILKDGTANITEVWDVKATSGTEWYKTMYQLNGSTLSDYVVYMDGEKMTYDASWDINDSLSQKAGYYGINYSSDGMELCFGKSDMKRHTFTLKYTLSNYIFNTDDSQVLYWTLMPRVTVDYFSVNVTSYYEFPDTLDVWGYGNKGYAYVKDGKISMSEEISLNDDYVVLLVKFPLNTFNTDFRLDEFRTFEDAYNDAEKGAFDYDYSNDDYSSDVVIWIVVLLVFGITFGYMFWVTYIFPKKKYEDKYKYINNKKIRKKDVPLFRDIPCNKDIYYANALIKINNFNYNKFNILGAILLKWIKEEKISFYNKEVGVFKKETSVIDLSLNPKFDNGIELELFQLMYNASVDGQLEAKELERWVKENYDNFLGIFRRLENRNIDYLWEQEHIKRTIKRKFLFEYKNDDIMDDTIYNDSIELYGLKKYLMEFSRINTREVMEVKLWDEYLMFAYLFGIADKVAKQLEDMYPEIMMQFNINYNVIDFIESVSTKTVVSAKSAKNIDEFRESMRESARSSADDYSSGGGGYSSGGGGEGSRGGGSSGSMGGR